MSSAHASRSRPLPPWLAPALVAATAIPTFAAFWIGGNPRVGVVWAAAALLFAAVLAIGRRSEPLRILAGVDDDERTREVEIRATAAMGTALTVALAAAFLISAARGGNGLVFGGLLVFAELVRRGWKDADLEKLAGGNLVRALAEAETVAARLQRERPPSTATIEAQDGRRP